MSLPLFLAHLKMARWGVVAWAGLFLVYGVLTVYLHQSLANAEGLVAYIESMPEAIKAAGGFADLSLEGGLFSMETWLVTEFLGWWPAIVAIYAIFAAGGIAAREVERGTMDLVLSQPVRRYQLIASKFAVFLVGLTGVALASLVGIVLGLALVDTEASVAAVALGILQGWLLVLAVGAYSVLFSCLFLDPRKTAMASGLVTAVFYIVNFMAPSLGRLEPVNRLSLFYYYRPYQAVSTGQWDWSSLGVFLAVTVACLAGAFLVFRRRDIVA